MIKTKYVDCTVCEGGKRDLGIRCLNCNGRGWIPQLVRENPPVSPNTEYINCPDCVDGRITVHGCLVDCPHCEGCGKIPEPIVLNAEQSKSFMELLKEPERVSSQANQTTIVELYAKNQQGVQDLTKVIESLDERTQAPLCFALRYMRDRLLASSEAVEVHKAAQRFLAAPNKIHERLD